MGVYYIWNGSVKKVGVRGKRATWKRRSQMRLGGFGAGGALLPGTPQSIREDSI